MCIKRQELCGLRTCGLNLTEVEEDCVGTVCTMARNLIAQTIAWPGTTLDENDEPVLQGGMVAFTNDDVEKVRANPKCCFEIVGAPCCHDPELPGCEEAATEEVKAKEVA